MAKKKKKEEKEPNLWLSLAAAIVFLAIITICLIDYAKQLSSSITTYGMIMAVFMGGCAIAIIWLIGYIIKRIRMKNK